MPIKSILLSLLCLILLYPLHRVSALTMSNQNWILQMGSVNNNFAGTKSNGLYKLRDTGGQIAPGLSSGSNAKVRAGFEYVESIIPFTFTISGEGVSVVNFGIVTPTIPVFRTQQLTLSNGSANGFIVTVNENHALFNPGTGATIADTSCNSGTCTPTLATLWDSVFAYGFGYRCDQVGLTNYCPSDFATTNYYRPIANSLLNQTPGTVMSGANVSRSMQVQITYKVNISTSQQAGIYGNDLVYTATPTF